MNNLVIIHVGKCGGSTVRSELESKNVKFSTIHVREAIYEPNKNYVIVIRNPIKRFISAFNWRYYLVCDSKIQKNKNEEKFLNKYKNVDNLCNAIEINSDIMNESTHHIVMDIYFYLKTFIKKCPKKQILGVICTETLKDDMKNIFDIDVIKHAKNNSKYNKIITD